jgi:hypothetical protein
MTSRKRVLELLNGPLVGIIESIRHPLVDLRSEYIQQ